MVEWIALGVAVLSLGVSGLAFLWESIVRPRRDRKAVRAALAAELADALKYMDAIVEQGRRDRSVVPPNFHVSNQVFVALAAQLGTLPPLMISRLVSVYRQLGELNWAPLHSKDLYADLASSESAPTTQWIQGELSDHARVFFDMVNTVRAHVALALQELGGVPQKPQEKALEEGRLQLQTSLENMRDRAGRWADEPPEA